jgi:hypothetical protein
MGHPSNFKHNFYQINNRRIKMKYTDSEFSQNYYNSKARAYADAKAAANTNAYADAQDQTPYAFEPNKLAPISFDVPYEDIVFPADPAANGGSETFEATFTIKEVEPLPAGWALDGDSEQAITLVFTWEEGYWVFDPDQSDIPDFTNVYTPAERDTNFTVKAYKIVEGEYATLTSGLFQFELQQVNEDDEPIGEGPFEASNGAPLIEDPRSEIRTLLELVNKKNDAFRRANGITVNKTARTSSGVSDTNAIINKINQLRKQGW